MAEPEKHTFDGHVDDGTEVEAEHFVEVEEGKGHEEGGSNSEEMIAGNPKLAEDRMTSLQLENVSPQAEGSKIEVGLRDICPLVSILMITYSNQSPSYIPQPSSQHPYISTPTQQTPFTPRIHLRPPS